MLLLGVIASLLAITGDVLIGYFEPLEVVAGYGIIREGYSTIALWRPVVSLVFAMIAFSLYLPAFWKIKNDLLETHPRSAEMFWWSSLVGALGWPLLHAAFCWPIYTYRILCDTVGIETAKKITVKIGYGIFPFALFYVILSAVPFAVLFAVIVRGKTIYPRSIAFFTPLVVIVFIYLLFYVVLPLNAVTYAVAIGIINECALILFITLLVAEVKRPEYMLSRRLKPGYGIDF